MTQPAAPGRFEALAEAIFPPGQHWSTSMLRVAGLCGVVAALFWGLGYAAELGFGLSIHSLPRTQERSVLGSLLLSTSIAASFGGIIFLLTPISQRLFERPSNRAVVTHTELSVPQTTAWWVMGVFTTLAVSLGIIVWGGVYAIDRWLVKGQNLFVAGEIGYIIGFAIFVGVPSGILVAIVDGTSRIFPRLRPSLIRSPRLWALVCIFLWPLLTAWMSFLLWCLSVVARWLLLAFGYDMSLTPASVIAGVLFSALFSLPGVWLKWQERSTKTLGENATSIRQDFWAWDLALESSQGGIAATGYPFYVWRESADNRLGLSRPRYCVIADDGRELNFMFFNPSADRHPTWAVLVGGLVAIIIAIGTTAGSWFGGRSALPLSYFETITLASLIGLIAGGAWHIGLILLRWNYGRFELDRHFTVKPLRLLSGFDMVHAGEIGAMVDGERAKTGNGLTATFDDGSMIILTSNAWNYRSVVEHHQELTNAFRVPRDDYVTKWEAKQKIAVVEVLEPEDELEDPSPDGPVVVAGVPDRL